MNKQEWNKSVADPDPAKVLLHLRGQDHGHQQDQEQHDQSDPGFDVGFPGVGAIGIPVALLAQNRSKNGEREVKVD